LAAADGLVTGDDPVGNLQRQINEAFARGDTARYSSLIQQSIRNEPGGAIGLNVSQPPSLANYQRSYASSETVFGARANARTRASQDQGPFPADLTDAIAGGQYRGNAAAAAESRARADEYAGRLQANQDRATDEREASLRASSKIEAMSDRKGVLLENRLVSDKQREERDQAMAESSARSLGRKMEGFSPEDQAFIRKTAGDRMSQKGEGAQEAYAAALAQATEGLREFDRYNRDIASQQQRLIGAQQSLQLAREDTGAGRAKLLRQWSDEAGGENTPEGANLLARAVREDRGGGLDNEAAGGGSQRFFGLRLGRLAQYATAGFIINEAARAGEAYETYQAQLGASGKDQQAQLQAELGFSQSIEATPIVGPLASLLTNSPYQKAAIEAQNRATEANEKRTQQIAVNADIRRQAQESLTENTLAGTSSYSANLARIEYAKNMAGIDERSRERKESQDFSLNRDAQEASAQADLDSISQGFNETGDSYHARQAAAQSKLSALQNTRAKDLSGMIADQKTASQVVNDAARAEALEKTRQADIERYVQTNSIETASKQYQRTMARDPFGANLAGIMGTNSKGVFRGVEPSERIPR
jgi:hypothetical protein